MLFAARATELRGFAAKNSQTVENDRETINHSAQQSQLIPRIGDR
jgi:hypothetical protein